MTNNKYLTQPILLISIFIIFQAFTIMNIQQTYCSPIHMLLKNKQLHLFNSKNVCMNIYKPKTGKIICTLTTNDAQYILNKKTIQFLKIKIIFFNEKNTAIWKITAEKAELTYNKTLHLYKNVLINNLMHNPYCEYIEAKNATIDLCTQEIYSNSTVILKSPYINSTAKKIRANLNTKNIKLIDNVKTYYNIMPTL